MGRTKEQAALRAGMHRNSVRKYADGPFPSERKKPREYRTRENPFEDVWPGIVEMLDAAPELEATTIFDDLCERHPDRFTSGQVRTLQRHIKAWRARHGPPKDLFFVQAHRPGEAIQTDFTHLDELEITIQGEPFPHMLCHSVLPYSDWSWGTICHSESMAAIRVGLQTALFRLGRVPAFSQTDHSTAATHGVGGKREFNREYEDLVDHFGMKPRTIGVGQSHQNGDVEAGNGALKRSIKQHLLLRGSRDFESVEAYREWLENILEKRNQLRTERLAKDLAAMSPLPARKLPLHSTLTPRVGDGATMRVKENTYSVPSRLRGEKVTVYVFEDRLEVYHGGAYQETLPRLRGSRGAHIQYRHVIDSLMRKPGAFRGYRYFHQMFPRRVFRQALDALDESLSYWKATVTYLRVLRLAAHTMEESVAEALEEILDAGEVPTFEEVEKRVAPREPEVPEVAIPAASLDGYDDLLDAVLEEEAA